MYKGELKNFPKEVVEKMLERQVEQDNERNVEVFEHDKKRGERKGFIWTYTTEGATWWKEVIENKNFSLFFEKYPKEKAKLEWGVLGETEGEQEFYDSEKEALERAIIKNKIYGSTSYVFKVIAKVEVGECVVTTY